MRGLALVLLLSLFAGCIDDVPNAESMVSFYRVSYDDSDVVQYSSLGYFHTGMGVISNVGEFPVIVAFGDIYSVKNESDDQSATFGWADLALQDGFASGFEPIDEFPDLAGRRSFTLEAKESKLVRTETLAYFAESDAMEMALPVRVFDLDQSPIDAFTKTWTITREDPGIWTQAGYHVQVVTVGMWVNGTSFYTNAAAAIQDPDFPGAPGWVTPEDGTDALPIYIYDDGPEEQPFSSRDNCYFTTISGFNSQISGSKVGITRVGLLTPEQAYSGENYTPDHDLYGDALAFMTTIIAVDGSNGIQDDRPDPQGACFSAERTCEYGAGRNGVPSENCPKPEDSGNLV
jgi:hypothetical protein